MTKQKKSSPEIEITNEKQLIAFKMRFKGHTYEQIATATEYEPRTLEVYFAKGGLWHDKYISWRTWQVESIKDQMDNMFVAQAVEANQQVVNISKGQVYIKVVTGEGETKQERMVPIAVKPDVILNAAKDILDRAGFKPAEKADSRVPEDIAEQMIEFFEGKEKEKLESKKGKKK
jgi:hypothetical protein